jgi:hypothetical protein
LIQWCSDENGSGKEVAGEFVVARGDAPPAFDPAEVVFDFTASPMLLLAQGEDNASNLPARCYGSR